MTEQDTDTLDAQVRAVLAAALDPEAERLGTTRDPVAATWRRVEQRRRRRRRRTAVLAAAASVLAVAGVVAVVSGGDDADRVDVVGPPDTTVQEGPDTSAPAPTAPDGVVGFPLPGVTGTPPAPLSTRIRVATAWTGSELVVWGGYVDAFNFGMEGPNRTFTDGAAYDPTTGTWRSMAPAPLPESTDTPVAAATGAGVVVARGTATALWDPISDTWRALPDAPAPVTDLVGSGDLAVSASAGAVLDLGTGEWEPLPPAPVTLDHSTTAWTGQELVVLGESGTPATTAVALVLDPDSRTWRATRTPPEWLLTDVAATWDGERVVVADYAMNAAAYDPVSDMWEELPSVPARFSEWGTSARTSPAGPVVAMANTLVVLGADGWTPLPTTVGGFWLGDSPTEPGAPLAIWHLTEDGRSNQLLLVDVDALATSGRRQVGVADVTLPSGAAQLSATTNDGGNVIALEIDLDGRTCSITSSYSGEDEPGLPVTEEVEGPGGAVQWSRDEAGTRWQAAATFSDRVEVTCDEATDARALVAGIAP